MCLNSEKGPKGWSIDSQHIILGISPDRSDLKKHLLNLDYLLSHAIIRIAMQLTSPDLVSFSSCVNCPLRSHPVAPCHKHAPHPLLPSFAQRYSHCFRLQLALTHNCSPCLKHGGPAPPLNSLHVWDYHGPAKHFTVKHPLRGSQYGKNCLLENGLCRSRIIHIPPPSPSLSAPFIRSCPLRDS